MTNHQKNQPITIRKAKLKEVPEIAKLGVSMIHYHHQLDDYEAPAKNIDQVYLSYFKRCIHSNKRLLLVAEHEGEIIGYALGKLDSRSPVFEIKKMGYINDMFVIEKYRRRGIAEKLLNPLFDWFEAKGISHVEINVHAKNEIGKRSWRKYGFEEYTINLKKKL